MQSKLTAQARSLRRVHSFQAVSMDLGGSAAVAESKDWVDFCWQHISILCMVPEV